jgi:hypothetical protein
MTEIWIRPGWTDWHQDGSSSTLLDRESAKRPYGHWKHADSVLRNESENEFARSSALTAMHRAMTQRAEHIGMLYDLKRIEELKDKKTLDQLESMGITRPLLLLNLRKLRNVVEHQDLGIPNAERTFEMLDLVWLFLKSTDPIVTRKLTETAFRDSWDDSCQLLIIEWDTGNWIISARGRLEGENFSYQYTPDSLRLRCDNLEEHPSGLIEFTGHIEESAHKVTFLSTLLFSTL